MNVFKRVATVLRYIVGVVFMLFGLLGTLIGIVAILDPVGTKMADDADPFGTPPTIFESLLSTLVYLGILGVGILLIRYDKKVSSID